MPHGVMVERLLSLVLTFCLRAKEQPSADGCLTQTGWANSVGRPVERQGRECSLSHGPVSNSA